MMRSFTNFFERFGSNLGLGIKLPRPGKSALGFSMVLNALLGVAMLVGGLFFSKRGFSLLGCLGISSAVLMGKERMNRNTK